MCAKKRTSPKSSKDNFEYEYDPIKREVGGQEAEKVIWSTSVLEKAVQAMNEGLPLKANPFCGKNTQLLKPELVYKRTEEEINEYIKCMQDPVHFAKYCKIIKDIKGDYFNADKIAYIESELHPAGGYRVFLMNHDVFVVGEETFKYLIRL